jgi:hypothetical protein
VSTCDGVFIPVVVDADADSSGTWLRFDEAGYAVAIAVAIIYLITWLVDIDNAGKWVGR